MAAGTYVANCRECKWMSLNYGAKHSAEIMMKDHQKKTGHECFVEFCPDEGTLAVDRLHRK